MRRTYHTNDTLCRRASPGLNADMSSLLSRALRALGCRAGSTLVGYSSLALLVAIAALTLLAGPGGAPPGRHVPAATAD